MNRLRMDSRVLSLMLVAGSLACGGGEPPAADEGEATDPGLTARVTGAVEASIEGRGDLTCIGQGDMGPGYLNIRDRRSPEEIVLRTPLDATPGTHPFTSGADMRRWGEVYVAALNLPLEGVMYAAATGGTLTLERFDARPGGIVRGSFDFTTGSGIRVEGRFEFEVPDDARERC
ncbi:MAG: hypothetical protein R3324_07790 [Halobacteriales archaeon]|nr:hypothetical protein [Halobacteriales archaeon]